MTCQEDKRLKIRLLVLSALLLAGCASEPTKNVATQKNTPLTQAPPSKVNDAWSLFTEDAASHYGVDEKLISAIISVESGGNPTVVSRSNAVGLMQIKASTAGREVYRVQGRRGQPSNSELRDPAKNIDIGTAYIKLLQDSALAGIRDPLTLRYATIVSYANGAGALLRTFSRDRDRAVAMINAMTPDEFYHHVQEKHPAAQAPRYLWKVTTAYRTI
ncbi:membrane-bound lytic murein transglycosylase EmtA [Pantoea sp.]|uniref:membrane-bound lytic murein transglycosylase EmtA n=1 Tax=Pantoea sp. TaxID=69393 RepID=UPI00289E5C0D|nr:membrane-bound lytic murein transglycosylase EmtA [Pantoea sp.]